MAPKTRGGNRPIWDVPLEDMEAETARLQAEHNARLRSEKLRAPDRPPKKRRPGEALAKLVARR